jgi:lysophospholipase L1-like esterase
MSKKIISICLCVVLAISGFAVACIYSTRAKGASSEPPVYLALGDSISYGYTVDGGQRTDTCFVRLLAENKGLNAINESISGNEAPGVIEQLNSGDLDDVIKKASIVTLTIGGNDMMEVLYQKTADAYGGGATANDIREKLSDDPGSDFKLLMALGSALLNVDQSTEFKTALSNFITNLNTITTYIKGKNPDAKIYVATQYDPYEHFSSALYSTFTQYIGKCLATMRDEVVNNATTGQYTAVDVYTAFKGNTATYCYAAESPSLQFDFHPNEAGHAAIAQCFIDAVTVD